MTGTSEIERLIGIQ